MNQNDLPYPDEFMYILNDSYSENILKYKDKTITYQLNSKSQENKPLLIVDSKELYSQKDKEEKPVKSKINIEIQIMKEITDSFKDKKVELPEQYLYDKIKNEIFSKFKLKDEIKKSFILDQYILNFENALSEDNENDLKEPLIRKSSKKIYHDCTNDLYEDNINEKDLFFQQNNNDNNYNKERDEIGNDEQIIRNIISSKGQFSSVLHSRNISK